MHLIDYLCFFICICIGVCFDFEIWLIFEVLKKPFFLFETIENVSVSFIILLFVIFKMLATLLKLILSLQETSRNIKGYNKNKRACLSPKLVLLTNFRFLYRPLLTSYFFCFQNEILYVYIILLTSLFIYFESRYSLIDKKKT